MAPFARKRFGQNFLVDRGVLRRIVEAVDVSHEDALLEIGPGRGALTERLLEHVARMGAVEVDRDLARALGERFAGDRLRLWTQDVLQLRLEDVRAELATAATALTVVGNLPYNISKPIAMKLVTERASVDRAVLMFQKEVAQRLTARPGSKAYGPLAILVGEVWRVACRFDIRPGAFRPRPKVTSTVTVWTRRTDTAMDAAFEVRLRQTLSACFARRRQSLRNNLRAAIGAESADRLLQATGIDPGIRAEALDPADFRRLAERWPKVDPPGRD